MADTILLEMTNSRVQQAADAELQLKAAGGAPEPAHELASDAMIQSAQHGQSRLFVAHLQSQTDVAYLRSGVISGLAYKASKGKADELTTRNGLADQSLASTQKSIDSQLAEQQTKVEQMRVLAQLKQKQLNALKVRAGIDGVLVDLPLQVGQHVLPGTMLAKVVNRII
jgi:multidrug resistance efflux pump